MAVRVSTRRVLGIGEILLLVYLIVVIAVAVMQAVVGWPTVADLASSPALLIHGEWWRLVTSALVVQGPAVPQIIAIAVLGSLSIYIGGSAMFWLTAVGGHFFGTLVAYVAIAWLWLADRSAAAHYMTDPDYGVSLIWCAALGAFAAWSWMGSRAKVRRPVHPWWAVVATLILLVVTVFSDGMTAVQHAVAFFVGVFVIATAGRSQTVHRERRPLVRLKRKAS